MSTQIMEHQDIHKEIDQLSDAAKEKLSNYISFLRYEEWLEKQEDAEDIADAEARRGEPTVPFCEIMKDYEAKHGPRR